ACHPVGLVQIGREPGAVELADDVGTAELFLVPVDLVAPRQPERAERQPRFAHLEAIAHDRAEEAVQRILTRHVSDILPVHHSLLPRPAAKSGHVKQRAVPSPYARHPLHLLFTAPSSDIEGVVRLLILASRHPGLARCYSWLAQLTKRGWGACARTAGQAKAAGPVIPARGNGPRDGSAALAI